MSKQKRHSVCRSFQDWSYNLRLVQIYLTSGRRPLHNNFVSKSWQKAVLFMVLKQHYCYVRGGRCFNTLRRPKQCRYLFACTDEWGPEGNNLMLNKSCARLRCEKINSSSCSTIFLMSLFEDTHTTNSAVWGSETLRNILLRPKQRWCGVYLCAQSVKPWVIVYLRISIWRTTHHLVLELLRCMAEQYPLHITQSQFVYRTLQHKGQQAIDINIDARNIRVQLLTEVADSEYIPCSKINFTDTKTLSTAKTPTKHHKYLFLFQLGT